MSSTAQGVAGEPIDEIKRMNREFDSDEVCAPNGARQAQSTTPPSIDSLDRFVFNEIEPLEQAATLPQFRVDALPETLRRYALAVSADSQTPCEMCGTWIIAALASIVQRSFSVEVRPGWYEPLNLYTCVIASPGERKSAVMKSVFAPIYDYETQREESDKLEIEHCRTQHKMLKNRLDHLTKQAATCKESERDALEQEALALEKEISLLPQPHELRLVTSDCTTEKLAILMQSNDESLALVSAEGSLFDELANGKYDDKSNAQLTLYLNAHAGDVVRVDRMARESVKLNHPHLTVALAAQPQIIDTLMQSDKLRGRGLIARFLFAQSDLHSLTGHRSSTPPPVPDDVTEDYYRTMNTLLDVCCNDTGYRALRVSEEADALRIAFQDFVESELNESLYGLRDFGSKLTGAMMRLAGLLHLAKCAEDAGCPTITQYASTPISGETVSQAVSLMEYYAACGKYIYSRSTPDQAVADARYCLKKLLSFSMNPVKKRDLARKCRRFSKTALDDALNTLMKRNYLREFQTDMPSNGGKQTEFIVINPAALPDNQTGMK